MDIQPVGKTEYKTFEFTGEIDLIIERSIDIYELLFDYKQEYIKKWDNFIPCLYSSYKNSAKYTSSYEIINKLDLDDFKATLYYVNKDYYSLVVCIDKSIIN